MYRYTYTIPTFTFGASQFVITYTPYVSNTAEPMRTLTFWSHICSKHCPRLVKYRYLPMCAWFLKNMSEEICFWDMSLLQHPPPFDRTNTTSSNAAYQYSLSSPKSDNCLLPSIQWKRFNHKISFGSSKLISKSFVVFLPQQATWELLQFSPLCLFNCWMYRAGRTQYASFDRSGSNMQMTVMHIGPTMFLKNEYIENKICTSHYQLELPFPVLLPVLTLLWNVLNGRSFAPLAGSLAISFVRRSDREFAGIWQGSPLHHLQVCQPFLFYGDRIERQPVSDHLEGQSSERCWKCGTSAVLSEYVFDHFCSSYLAALRLMFETLNPLLHSRHLNLYHFWYVHLSLCPVGVFQPQWRCHAGGSILF